MHSGYRMYIYICRECRSVLVKLHPSQSIGLFWGNAWFLCWMPPVVSFGFTNCVLLYDKSTNTRMLVSISICFKQHFDTRYFLFCNLSPPRMFCPWTFFKNIGFNMVSWDAFMSHLATYSTRIFYRGVSDFVTDCPGGVLCRALTACRLHVGPLFGNRLLNNRWAVGLTWWIVNLHGYFLYFDICNCICLNTWYDFSGLSLHLK